jgi:serine/threonine-protein kinase HipA
LFRLSAGSHGCAFYDIASTWPYPRRIPPQKMKLAMRIGRHYRVREIQLGHFAELAKACSYPEERAFDLLRNLAEELPDEPSGVARSITTGEVGRAVIDALLDKLSGQCRQTLRRFAAVQ